MTRSSGSGTVATQRLGLVGIAEPAALGEGRGENPLQLRRCAGDDPLRLGEALGVDQPLDRGLECSSPSGDTARSYRPAIRDEGRGREAGKSAHRGADQPGEGIGARLERPAGQEVPRRRRSPQSCRSRRRRPVGLSTPDREPGGQGTECHPVTAGDRRWMSLGVGDPLATSMPSHRRRSGAAPSARVPRRRSMPGAKIASPTATTKR